MSRPTRRPLHATSMLTMAGAIALLSLAASITGSSSAGRRSDAAGPAAGSTGAGSGSASIGRDAAPAAAIAPTTVSAPSTTAFNPTKVSVGLSLVRSGFNAPVLVTSARDGSGRLFVVEQGGLVKIINKDGTVRPTPFLDLRTSISSGGERGLLGLAFHPGFKTHPTIFVNFTDRNGNTAITRFTVGSNPNVAVRSSGVRLITIGQPYANHNGGNLAFGPDGFLYVGMGDGGSGGDPQNRAQNINSLLGKMLRIDVNHGTSARHYAIPPSNPYVGKFGNDLIWSRGLRNPWRWSFDRVTGQLWIADVGQDRWEEVNRSSPHGSTPAGRAVNYGWNVLEGRACFKPSSGCSTSGKQPPQTVYGHSASVTANCAVTGGFVYRGSAFPALAGGYVFGDFCSGRIWVMSPLASAPVTPTLVRDAAASPHLAISSFGESDTGELYVCDLAGGAVYRVTAAAKP